MKYPHNEAASGDDNGARVFNVSVTLKLFTHEK